MAHRIDPRKLAPVRVDDFMFHGPVDSWRDDAFDPDVDGAIAAPPVRRDLIELSPGVWVYPEFLDLLERRSRFDYTGGWDADHAF